MIDVRESVIPGTYYAKYLRILIDRFQADYLGIFSIPIIQQILIQVRATYVPYGSLLLKVKV